MVARCETEGKPRVFCNCGRGSSFELPFLSLLSMNLRLFCSITFVAYPTTYVIIQPPPSPDDRGKRALSVTQLGLEAELPMLPTKTRLPKTAKLLRNWLMCFCLGGLMAVSVMSESIAPNINAQAPSTTAPQDSKDSEA